MTAKELQNAVGVNNKSMRPSRLGPESRHLNGRVCSLQSLTANVNGNLFNVNLRSRHTKAYMHGGQTARISADYDKQ